MSISVQDSLFLLIIGLQLIFHHSSKPKHKSDQTPTLGVPHELNSLHMESDTNRVESLLPPPKRACTCQWQNFFSHLASFIFLLWVQWMDHQACANQPAIQRNQPWQNERMSELWTKLPKCTLIESNRFRSLSVSAVIDEGSRKLPGCSQPAVRPPKSRRISLILERRRLRQQRNFLRWQRGRTTSDEDDARAWNKRDAYNGRDLKFCI